MREIMLVVGGGPPLSTKYDVVEYDETTTNSFPYFLPLLL
jgi:hypothetical protein